MECHYHHFRQFANCLEPGFTVKETLDIIYGEENVSDIYIGPPDSAILTDEDSGDEEEGGAPDNLSGNQLLAEADLRITDGRELLPHPQTIETPGIHDEYTALSSSPEKKNIFRRD